jgi:predicted nucleotidyltransferase
MEALTENLAARLGKVEGIEAVVLGGSHASDTASDDSDIDLGLYYEPDSPPSIAVLNALAAEVDDRHQPDLVTEIGEWGPWINGGAWLIVEGKRVDWLFRDLARVRQAVEDCSAGRITCDYQPGHPHGFHNHMYMAEVHIARVLFECEGALTALQEQTTPYPSRLRAAVIRKYAWEAGFSLEVARKPAARGDVAYVTGSLYRTIACLVQVLFALNERYFLNEKRSVAIASGLPLSPTGSAERAQRALGGAGTVPADLTESLRAADALLAETRSLCPPDLLA